MTHLLTPRRFVGFMGFDSMREERSFQIMAPMHNNSTISPWKKIGISFTLLQTNPPRPPPSLSHPQTEPMTGKTKCFLSLTRSAPL